MLYHLASVYGVLHVFGDHLNPEVAPLPVAAGMHAVYAGLFCIMILLASDDLPSVKPKSN